MDEVLREINKIETNIRDLNFVLGLTISRKRGARCEGFVAVDDEDGTHCIIRQPNSSLVIRLITGNIGSNKGLNFYG